MLTEKLNCEQKKQIIKSTVWNVAQHAIESWTLTEASKKLLEVFEMWTWQGMLIAHNQSEKLTNKALLVRADEARRRILKMIWCRKHRWLGHVLRHDNLLHDIIEGKMLGKATRGKKSMELLDDMM